MAISPSCLFSIHPTLTIFFCQYCPNEIRGKHKNKLMWQNYFLMFRRLQNDNTSCFYKQHFHLQRQAEIYLKWWWSQYQNEPKEKQTLQIKDLMSKEHYCYKVYALLQLSVYIHGLPPPVLQANLKRPSIFDFLKIWTPCL